MHGISFSPERPRTPAWVPIANATLARLLSCLPTTPALPPGENGDFGMSPIYGQLSNKRLLAFVITLGC